jgi:hypothetical protein
MDAAPRLCTANGAMPVTRMTPARPMTKAPHQFVPRCREPSSRSVCTGMAVVVVVGPVLRSLAM